MVDYQAFIRRTYLTNTDRICKHKRNCQTIWQNIFNITKGLSYNLSLNIVSACKSMGYNVNKCIKKLP